MQRRTRIILATVFAVIIIGASVATVIYILSQPDVRIGYLTADLHHLPLFVAVDQGYFLEEGLRVALVPFDSGNLAMTGFMGNAIDMSYLGAAPALNFHIREGVDIGLLAGVNMEGSGIVVANTINQFSDLVGTIVATPAPGNVQDILFALACNQSNLDFLSDFTRVHLTPTQMIQQLDSGLIDAFVAWEPYIASSQTQGVGKILNTSNEIWPNHPCCVVASQASFLQFRPDIVAKVIAVHLRAITYIRNNPQQAAQTGAEWTGLTATVIEQAMSRIIYNESLIVEGFRTYLRALIQFNFLPDFDESQINATLDYIVDTRFLPGG